MASSQPVNLQNVRSGHLGVITKIEKFVESCFDEVEIPTTAFHLKKQLTALQTARQKYKECQQQIIDSLEIKSKKEHEQEALTNTMAKCDQLHSKLEQLLDEVPEDPMDTSLSEMREWVNHTVEEERKKHREEVNQLLQQIADSVSARGSSQEETKDDSVGGTTSIPLGATGDLTKLLRTMAETNSKQMAFIEKLTSDSTSHKPHIKLPQISLPAFSGKYSEWTAFKDQFEASIVAYPHLAPVQKLHYLKSALTGEAAAVIRHLPSTAANFEVAWKSLKDRFEKPYNIVMDHIHTFRALQPVSPSNLLGFSQLCSTASETVLAVRAAGVHQFDLWLIHDILQKLDDETKLLWSQECDQGLPDWDNFITFLFKRRDNLEACGITKAPTTKPAPKHGSSHSSSRKSNTTLVATNAQGCKCCNKNAHPLFKCAKFLAQSPEERFNTVKQLGLCRNCITANHDTKSCTYYMCRKCNGRHNVLLHDKFSTSSGRQDSNAESNQTTANPPESAQPSTSQSSVTNVSQVNVTAAKPQRVFLATAMVDVVSPNGRKITCRALLDCGSQRNILSLNLQRQLNLPKRHTTFSMTGIGGNSSTVSCVTQAIIHSKILPHTYNLEFLVIPKITGDLPNWSVNSDLLPIPPGIQLADPDWFVQKPIDILIGGEAYWDMILDGSIELGEGLPILKPTTLGYVIVGALNHEQPEILCNLAGFESLDVSLQRLWQIEDIPKESKLTEEQLEAEAHFASTYRRTEDGRFLVQLPFRKDVDGDVPLLGTSRPTAVRQLFSLERRFEKNPELKTLYTEVMRSYVDKGWMERVPREALTNYSYYMPHHGVLKESTSTRLRVVYNATSKTSNGLSLNDILLTGPTVHSNLFHVLLRFRKFKIAVTADISKMYLQLVLHVEHTDFQRLVWRESPSEPIQDFRITRVCFGIRSSPFLATRALVQLAQDNESTHPLAAQIIRNCFYVDDCIYSAETVAEAKTIRREVEDVMAQGGFELAKWTSNHEDVEPHSNAKPTQFHTETAMKTLGLIYDAQADVFRFASPLDPVVLVATKRSVASATAKIFDSLGLISPVVIVPKMLLQELHKAELQWDDEVSPEHLAKWSHFVHNLEDVNQIRIPRWIGQSSSLRTTELHGFCDASTKAYGAAIYFVGRDKQGGATSHLIVSKSKVAPMEPPTIPRLELCGAVLLAELMNNIMDIYLPDTVFYWTDSMIVLGWLNSPPDSYRVFVAKRVRDILKLTHSEQWNHVPTQHNPADLISRGTTPSQLAASDLWWNGPKFLLENEQHWPRHPNCSNPIEEAKQITLVNEVQHKSFFPQWMEDVSSLRRLQVHMAYVLRFIHSCGNPRDNFVGPIAVEERERALRRLIYLDQHHYFPEVMNNLQRDRPLPPSWRFLSKLSPFLDAEGLARVGGRLEHSEESYSGKHPIILPRTKLQELIVVQEHNRLLHAAPTLLLATLRQRYWPLSGGIVARKVFRSCLTCFKTQPRMLDQLMGNLPRHRVTFTRPFYATGVDYAGPIAYKSSTLRSAKILKSYISVFVCLSTKAFHLELVADQTKEAFLAAFNRFVGRRSVPRHMYSDCGTNFVGANREIIKLFEDTQDITTATAELGVIWHFNPPGAPHHGGLWEAGVKSVKYHLYRVLHYAPKTFEEIATILCQIESHLNSRPLFALSEDPSDADFLTPGHFLTGGPLNMLPEPCVLNLPENRLSRWQACQRRTQEFAEKWRREYLNTLQQRSKWRTERANLEIGNVVLIWDDASSKWKLGRVEEVHAGLDGLVRVVTVRTSGKLFRRPVTKIALLPFEDHAGQLPSPGSMFARNLNM